MARALAHKRATGEKSRRVVRPVKKTKAKHASPVSHGEPASKARTRKEKVPDVAVEKKASPLAQKPVYKESTMIEAESRKPALRTGVTSAFDAQTRLLRQTKTTSAALALLEKGIELLFKKDFRKARTEFTTLLENYPAEIDILARARSYIQICDREEANLRKTQVSTDQLYALGVLEHNKANYDTAISYFLKSLENHPRADYIYYSVAASQAMKGDVTGSIENLRRAVELNEDSRIYAKNDSDFTALQTNREFAELVGNPIPSAETQ